MQIRIHIHTVKNLYNAFIILQDFFIRENYVYLRLKSEICYYFGTIYIKLPNMFIFRRLWPI